MYVTSEQIKEFEQKVMDNTLHLLGMCRKCAQHRWSTSEVVARFRLMNQRETAGLMPDVERLISVLRTKHGCAGCADLRVGATVCLIILLKDLKVHDARKGKI